MIGPGLFDLQVNGYAGVDFNDTALTAGALDRALEAMLADGVTGCLPTLITASPEQLHERFRALDDAVRLSRLGPAMVPGYHLEGPFLNAAEGYRGCHPPAAMIDPDPALIDRLDLTLSRPILMVTLAPERRGGVEAIAALHRRGKTVAIGHSAADHDGIAAAVQAGASLSTHLGNGLPQDLPKLNNSLLAQLAQPGLQATLIADGHHIPPAALAALIRLKGPENCILTTDAVVAAAAPEGRYCFAGMEIERDAAGAVRQPGGIGLAGSALCLDEAVRNLVAWNIAEAPLALRMASDQPRAALAASLAHHRIVLTAGEVAWNVALEPEVRKPGNSVRQE